MKPKPFLSSLAVLLAAGPAFAQQETPPARPLVQNREPFLKERGAPSTAPDNSGVITSMTSVFEVFTMPEADANELLAGPPDGVARYRRVNELLKLGKARLDVVEAIANRSQARSNVESWDEASVPQEYIRGENVGGTMVAPSLQQMQFGDHVEVEGSLSSDARTCNLNVNLEDGQLLGFRPFHVTKDGPVQEGGIMERRNIITSLTVRTGEPVLLGTLNRPPSVPGRLAETSLAFVRLSINRDRPEGTEPPVGALGYLEQTLWFYSLDRAAARDLLAADYKPGALYDAVQDLAKANKAHLEHTVFLPSQPGVQGTINENWVLRAPSSIAPIPAEPPVMFPKMPVGDAAPPKEMQPSSLLVAKMPGLNMGFSGDLGSEVGPPDALIRGLPLTADFYANLWWRADLGYLQDEAGHPLENPERPALEMRHLSGYFRCYASVPSFVGTLNPPRKTGVNNRKDDGRTWMCFVRIQPVRP